MTVSQMTILSFPFKCLFYFSLLLLLSCNKNPNTEASSSNTTTGQEVNPKDWPSLQDLSLNPEIESRIDTILSKLSLEQKVGQIIQADNASITPEEVKNYKLGSVLSGGNSAPGPLPYADAKTWLSMADDYYNASIDNEGVEIAIPCIWGIDAVHGHANLKGAIVFPHNIGLGAMHNPQLVENIARITAIELTVSGHDWTFAPTLTVPQDIRWGRSYEGFSENPQIVADYSPAIVKGLQGELGDSSFMSHGKVISCAKHFIADGATENGADQGDAKIPENELIDIHGKGYYTALPAGVQTVMASFSSWNGTKLHGDKRLLTDVLKGQLGFNGFVVGDWNGHGQVPGCTNTDCAQSFNAGVDMFMAPDSWKGLYHSTLKHVKSGTIPLSRLDDAVRRILRVKLASGIFEKGAPSTRKYAGDEQMLGLPKHRDIARQAVRESLVLLKNNNSTLPLDPSQTVLVIGEGADNISKACGGWTLSWQGKGHSNDEFPNGMSILQGIQEAVKAANGKVVFSPSGELDVDADIVIAVYGEDPYAEFQGDRKHLGFTSPDLDTDLLDNFQKKDIPVVSVFLSGRPLWCNQEINDSDAFIAAWLPGTEGGGIADMLFRSNPAYEFKGKLSFSWPSRAIVQKDNSPLFDLGYGLNYDSEKHVESLPEIEDPELSQPESTEIYYAKGTTVNPWALWIAVGNNLKKIEGYPFENKSISVGKVDHLAQEDALQIDWIDGSSNISIRADQPIDLSRQSNGALELSFFAKSLNGKDAVIQIGMCDTTSPCSQSTSVQITSEWKEYRVSLSCFDNLGVDMSKIFAAFTIQTAANSSIGLNSIGLQSDLDGIQNCGG